MRRWTGIALLLVPLLIALFGPWIAAALDIAPGQPYAYAPEHVLGTDGLGRDVLTVLLQGGRSVLLLALVAVALADLIGVTVGLLAAATRQRWLDELLMRPLEILLAVPSLLLLSVVAVWWRAQAPAIAVVVALMSAPAVARLVRATALEAASSPVAEAMALQGESRLRIGIGFVGRAILRPLASDAGVHITSAVYLVASANFLGLGLDPTATDWAVAVGANKDAFQLQPLSVLAPTFMIIAFTIGVNLLSDDVLARRLR